MDLNGNIKMNRYSKRLYEEWKIHGKIICGVDFDDTISPWKFRDEEGLKFIDKTIQLLRVAKQTGAYIVIFTACAPDRHDEIKYYCNEVGLEIDAINSNPIDLPYGKHGKIFANIFVDDRAGINEALEILEEVMYKVRSDQNKVNLETWLK
jgi:hypothetical protein